MFIQSESRNLLAGRVLMLPEGEGGRWLPEGGSVGGGWLATRRLGTEIIVKLSYSVILLIGSLVTVFAAF